MEEIEKSALRTKSRLPKPVKTILTWLGKALSGIFKSIGSLLIFFLFFGLIGSFLPGSLGGQGPKEIHIKGEGERKIVVLPLTGVILNQAEPGSVLLGSGQAITPGKVRAALARVKNDEKAAGVILNIESPGGSAVASDRVFEEIESFKKESGKPVVALLGDTAASGGYFIAAAADSIVANRSSLTGSIGVIASTINLEGLYEKLGIKQRVFKQGKFKDILSSSREVTAEETKIIDSILEDAYDLFLERVAAGRGISLEKAAKIAEGRIYSGEQAREAGLVDELGNLDRAVEITRGLAGIEQAKVVELQSGGFLESLLGGVQLNFLSRLLPSPMANSNVSVWYLLSF